MLAVCKQPGLHQTITLMFMLKGHEITKVPGKGFMKKNLPGKDVP